MSLKKLLWYPGGPIAQECIRVVGTLHSQQNQTRSHHLAQNASSCLLEVKDLKPASGL